MEVRIELQPKLGSISYQLLGDVLIFLAVDDAHLRDHRRRLCKRPQTKSFDVEGSVKVLWRLEPCLVTVMLVLDGLQHGIAI